MGPLTDSNDLYLGRHKCVGLVDLRLGGDACFLQVGRELFAEAACRFLRFPYVNNPKAVRAFSRRVNKKPLDRPI